MLKHRIQSGILLGTAVLASIFLLPESAIILVLWLLAGLAMVEFYALLDVSRIPHFKIVGILGGLALITVTWFASRLGWAHRAELEMLTLFVVTAAVFVRQISHRDVQQPWQTMAGTLLGVLYVAFLFNFIVKMLGTWGDWEGRLLVLYLAAVVKFTDIGAYFVGCAIGRHKLIPRISPAKSWEGCVGGVATGMAASLLYVHLTRAQWHHVSLDLRHALILGFLLAVAGIVGDLIESVFKRAAGVKDSGTWIQGMGGLLDVLDSLLFAAPVLYGYALWFMNSPG